MQAIVGLADAAKSVVESPADAVSPDNEGKLVHVVGAASAAGPIEDSDLSLSFADQVAVNRAVDMYQWKEKKDEKSTDNTGGSKTTTTTYTYSQDWSDSPIDSTSFAHPEGHENPAMPFTSHRYAANDAKLGGFTLDETTLGLVDVSAPLKPDAPDGWTQSGGNLYKGQNPSTPAIGDMRVHYTGLPSGTTISVLAQQNARRICTLHDVQCLPDPSGARRQRTGFADDFRSAKGRGDDDLDPARRRHGPDLRRLHAVLRADRDPWHRSFRSSAISCAGRRRESPLC